MTAYGNEQIAAEALRQGAVSYVPKSRRSATLLQTVTQVLERVSAVQSQKRLSKCLHRIESSYVLDNDPSLLKPLLDMVESTLASVGLSNENDQVRVGVALEEALLNAIYHGNLSMGEESYAEVRQSGQDDRLTELRRQEAPYCDRKITFKMKISGEGAQFVIRDEGNGCRAFVLQPHSDPQEIFENGRHRGTALMRYLMDDVQYNDVGNEVKLYVRSGEPT
jgi:anti-sigma regulatory factor (Ser/Thr protein kinase)